MPTRAPFIVLEGLDRSGKTTQTTSLHARLTSQNLPAELFKFPNRTTPIGKMLDAYLRGHNDLDDHAVHLLFAANRWECAETITHHLTTKTTIIADRYAFSGLAFSAAKGLPHTWCANPDAGLPAPDLTLFLDVDPETAKTRGGFGEERYEREEMQKSVRGIFERVGREVREGGGRWVVIDASQSKEVVEEAIWGHVQPLLKGIEEPIGQLWETPDQS